MSWQPDRGTARAVLPAVAAALWIAVATPAPGAAAETPAPKPAPKPAPAAAAPAPEAARGGTDVVARVNGTPILRRDFELMVQVQFSQLPPDQRRHDDLDAVRDAVLDNLIDNELLYQRASQAKISVGDAEVREESVRLKALLGSPAAADTFLRQSGISEKELASQVRRSLVVKRFVDRDVAPGLEVTEAQARAWYDAHPEVVNRPESVRISQIVVQVAPQADTATRAAARHKIEEILKEIKAGKDFAEMARRHSDGPEAKTGGDVGFVWAGGGALPSVERAALALKPGQMSDIVESRRGFHLIKAVERRPAGPVPFTEMRAAITERLVKEQRDERLRVYVAGLRRGARVEKVS
jgi:peptidyl-prolyl cis-trans isomerase C